jgi:hypothetical protein
VETSGWSLQAAQADQRGARRVGDIGNSRIFESYRVLGAIAVVHGSHDEAFDHRSTALRLASQIEYSRERDRAASALRLWSAS